MTKHAAALPFTTPVLDRASPVPMHLQLYEWLREAILTGRIAGGVRLPATRPLAAELSVSRNTVLNTFDQLLAEGYLEGRVGDGTYVSRLLPEGLLQAPPGPRPPTGTEAVREAGRAISRRGALVAAMSSPATWDFAMPRAFHVGLPALDAFPSAVWAHLLAKRWRNPGADMLGPGDPAGYRPLREAIAGYLGAARAVRCHPDQIIVTAGSQQGLDLAARVLLDPGDVAWIEDPGYPGARGALLGAGVQLTAVPVDEEGLDVAAGIARAPAARLVYVSPSCQFPLGVTMSLARRLALLAWAARARAWVLEDDYNSEYRYANRPLASLQGIDTAGRVIYLGSFSKILFPAMRLGYLVVPPDLVDSFIAMRSRSDGHSPTLDQAVVADFIGAGHFARHIRRMRALYAERQAILVEAVAGALGGRLDVQPAESGMHLIGRLPAGADDQAAAALALRDAVFVHPLSAFYAGPRAAPPQTGLLLGYTGVAADEIRQGVARLARALGAGR